MLERRCVGDLIQIDGCDHEWFEDRAPRCTLLVYVDDATNRLMEIRFVASASTFDYFASTASYLERHGMPVAFYSDQARLDDLEVRSYSRQDQQWKYSDVDKGFKTSGFLQTLDELYFNQINGNVLLSSPVTEINTTGPQPYALVGADKHFANAILVTVSAGVINAGDITFVPALPTAKTDAYATLNMPVGGTGASVILKWDHVFWGSQSE